MSKAASQLLDAESAVGDLRDQLIKLKENADKQQTAAVYLKNTRAELATLIERTQDVAEAVFAQVEALRAIDAVAIHAALENVGDRTSALAEQAGGMSGEVTRCLVTSRRSAEQITELDSRTTRIRRGQRATMLLLLLNTALLIAGFGYFYFSQTQG